MNYISSFRPGFERQNLCGGGVLVEEQDDKETHIRRDPHFSFQEIPEVTPGTRLKSTGLDVLERPMILSLTCLGQPLQAVFSALRCLLNTFSCSVGIVAG